MKQPAVANVTMLGGMDFLGGGFNATNAATMFVTLKPFERARGARHQRRRRWSPRRSRQFGTEKDGLVLAFNPPAIQGLGAAPGSRWNSQERGGGTIAELAAGRRQILRQAAAQASRFRRRSAARSASSLPQLFVDVNREKTKMMGVKVADVFDTMQALFGSLYVNDFNKFGRIWAGAAPGRAELPQRARGHRPASTSATATGKMVPLSGVVESEFRAGPNAVSRFNGFPSVQIAGAPVPGTAPARRWRRDARSRRRRCRPATAIEWSGASYQEVKAGNQAPMVLAFGLVVVFLVLAAQYERGRCRWRCCWPCRSRCSARCWRSGSATRRRTSTSRSAC